MGILWNRKSFDRAFMENINALGINSAENYSVKFDEGYRLKENKVWFEGNSSEIQKFYKTVRPKNLGSYYVPNFYARINTGDCDVLISPMHYNLPNIITSTMADLLFSNMPEIRMSTGNKSRDKKLNAILDDIFYDNDFANLLQDSAELESYSGAVAFKIVIDEDYDYPRIIPYPKEKIEVVKKYKTVQEIIFKDIFTVADRDYTLCSIYGRGYISYRLYLNEKEVPLSTIPETSKLKDIKIVGTDGKPLRRLLAVYKENKNGARSDFDGCIDDFCAYDALYTDFMDLTEKANVLTYMPESLMKKDTRTNNRIVPSSWNRNIITLHDNNPTGSDNEKRQQVIRDIPDISNTMTAYKDAMNHVLTNCLLTAGISPATVGYDVAGANSSGLALSIRERASIRTRDAKIILWTNTLKDLSELLLDYYYIEHVRDNEYVIDDFDNDVFVKFAEYQSYERFGELVDMISKAKDAGLIDIDKSLDILNREFYHVSPEELAIMKMNITNELPTEEDIITKEINTEQDEDLDDSMKIEDNKNNGGTVDGE